MSGTDIEVIDEGGGELQPSGNLFGTQNPVEVVAKATEVADALSDVLEKKKLYTLIKGKKFVRVEGWTLLGTMLGVFPVPVWTKKLDDGWEARVEARTLTGAVVGAADAECLRSEAKWKNSDDYAIKSMAQTRATSKAMRGPLGFIVTLAGYEATPFEEMPQDTRSGATVAATPDSSGAGIASGEGDGSPDIPAGAGPSPDLSEQEARRVAIGTLSSALKHAEQHGSLPPGHKDWASYLKWYIERYGIDPSDWRTALTPAQILEIALHLHDSDIPL